MPITVESLQEKIKGLKTQLPQIQDQAQQLQGQIFAIGGAIQVLELLIKESAPAVEDPTFQ